MADLGLLLEAEKRGFLPADKQALLTEARKRGLVPGGEVLSVEAPAPPSYGAVALNAPYRGIANVADTLLNAPVNLANLGIAGYGTLKGVLGGTDLPETMPTPDYVRRGMEKIGLVRDLPNMTPGQRVLDVGIQAATGGAIMPGGGFANAPRNALLAGTGGVAGQATTEATGNPLLGLGVSALVPGALSASATLRQNKLLEAQQRNAVRDDTLRAAQKLGLQVTPGSVVDSPIKHLIEFIAGKGPTQQVMSAKNQINIDSAARNAVGLPKNAPLTTETMRKVRAQAYKAGYAPVENLGVIQTDANFNTALQTLKANYAGAGKSFPGAVPEAVTKLIKSFSVGQFDAKDAVRVMRTLRDSAASNFKNGDNELAKAQTGIASALEGQIERHLVTQNAPDLLTVFRQARQRMAISHTIEDAIQEGSGSVNPRKLASDIQSGKYLTGDLQAIANFANTKAFQGVTQMPIGTPGIDTFGIGRAGVFTVPVGYAVGGPVGGFLGAAGSAITPMMTRRYLMSDWAQRNAIPNYNPVTNAFADAGPQSTLGAVNALASQ
ncbi:MAG: hypothetical protein ACR2K1_04125 [Saprospiraceae bacterium]